MDIQLDNNTPFFKSDGTANPEAIKITIVLDDSDVIEVIDPETFEKSMEPVTIADMIAKDIKATVGTEEIQANIEFSSTIDKSYENIDPSTGEVTDVIDIHKDYGLKISLPKNQNTEAMVEGKISFKATTQILNIDPSTKLYSLIDYKSQDISINFKQEPGLAEVESPPEVSEEQKGNLIFSLIAAIAFPTLQAALDTVLGAAQKTFDDLTAELADITEQLKNPDLSPKAKEKLEKKFNKIKSKLATATEELAQATKDAANMVKDEVQKAIEDGGCLVKDIQKHFNNIAIQTKTLVTGVPKLLQSGITSVIEPMTAITACPVGPAITATNPSQILGTLTRLKQQASTLNTCVQSLEDSIDFLYKPEIPGFSAVFEPMKAVLTPIKTILEAIDKIPG